MGKEHVLQFDMVWTQIHIKKITTVKWKFYWREKGATFTDFEFIEDFLTLHKEWKHKKKKKCLYNMIVQK